MIVVAAGGLIMNLICAWILHARTKLISTCVAHGCT